MNISTTNHTPRSSPSPFERHLAKYRSLPLLWLRACGSSNQPDKRYATIGNIPKDTINPSSDHQFGESENPFARSCLHFHLSKLLFTYAKKNVERYL